MFRNNKSDDLHQIVMLSYNGYTFLDIFKPIIESLAERCSISVFIVNITLSDAVKSQIKKLLSDHKICFYQIIEHYDKYKTYDYHKMVFMVVTSIQWQSVDLFLTSCDYSILERYFLIQINKYSVKTVTIQPTHLGRFHSDDRTKDRKTIRKKYLAFEQSLLIEADIKLTDNIRRMFRIRTNILKLLNIKRLFIVLRYTIANNFIFPMFLTRHFISKNIKYNNYVFTAGLTDLVLVYDEGDANAIKKIIPEVKSIKVVQHPASESCFCVGNSNTSKKTIVLLLIGGLHYKKEVDEEKIVRWGSIIQQVYDLQGRPEFHLRFHPRTNKYVEFVSRLKELVEDISAIPQIINSSEVPLSTSVCDYAGVVGAVGSALSTARASCKRAFVIGVPDIVFGYPDGFFDKKTLGNAKNICWLDKGQRLTKDHLKMKQANLGINNKASSEILSFLEN